MLINHWTCYGTEKYFVPNEDKFGFVYIITNTKNGKAYVGCKQYYIGKSKKQSRWQTYTGSSKYLNEDIKKIGKKYFTFEVIAEYKNKRSLRYYEMYYQVKWNVLTATIEGSDNPAFYNSYVGGKFYRPIESYETGEDSHMYGRKHTEETKIKMSEARAGEKHYNYKGKVEFYLDEKRMIVNCLSTWANENGYNKGNIYQIAHTYKYGFCKDNSKSKGIRTRFKHKGPLGTITKVKYIDNEE